MANFLNHQMFLKLFYKKFYKQSEYTHLHICVSTTYIVLIILYNIDHKLEGYRLIRHLLDNVQKTTTAKVAAARVQKSIKSYRNRKPYNLIETYLTWMRVRRRYRSRLASSRDNLRSLDFSICVEFMVRRNEEWRFEKLPLTTIWEDTSRIGWRTLLEYYSPLVR